MQPATLALLYLHGVQLKLKLSTQKRFQLYTLKFTILLGSRQNNHLITAQQRWPLSSNNPRSSKLQTSHELATTQFACKISMFSFSESISERVPFAGSSIHGPFIMLRMLQASLYSRSGRSLGVRRKHLQAKKMGGYHMSGGLQICALYKVLNALSLTAEC